MKGSFSVVRYVPDPVRNEPINIGIVLQCGDAIVVRVPRDALQRAISSDPQADKAALSRVEQFVYHFIQEARASRRTASSAEDPLAALTLQTSGKLTFSKPQFVEVGSPDDINNTLEMLVSRLVRPLRQRPIFAPIESPPRREIRRKLQPWIARGQVKPDYPLPSLSGRPRVAHYYFENGRTYIVKHVQLNYKRESQLFYKAQSEAFEIEDIRQGVLDRCTN